MSPDTLHEPEEAHEPPGAETPKNAALASRWLARQARGERWTPPAQSSIGFTGNADSAPLNTRSPNSVSVTSARLTC